MVAGCKRMAKKVVQPRTGRLEGHIEAVEFLVEDIALGNAFFA